MNIVLQCDGYAVERATDATLLALAVEALGFRHRIGIYADAGIQAVLVKGDAHQVSLHEIPRRQAPFTHRALHIRDACLHDVEGLVGARLDDGVHLAADRQ